MSGPSWSNTPIAIGGIDVKIRLYNIRYIWSIITAPEKLRPDGVAWLGIRQELGIGVGIEIADSWLTGGHGPLPGPLSGAGDVVGPSQTPAEVTSEPGLLPGYPGAGVRVTMWEPGQLRARDQCALRRHVTPLPVTATHADTCPQ